MVAWEKYLSDHDRAVIARGKFQQRMGFGKKAAVIVIDCQNYMVGARGEDDARYPSRCGPEGWAAIDRIAVLLAAARSANVPIFYTKFELDPTGADIGVYGLKRQMLDTPYWCLKGTIGAEIIDDIVPAEDDYVYVKKKPSAFHGTPLAGLLVSHGIDTVIVVGGATSNCVRATVFDASSNNYRVIVPSDCVFDRIEISHDISLFDMDRQFADVVESSEVVRYFEGGEPDGT